MKQMKQIKQLNLAFLLATIVFFYSCDNSDNPTPESVMKGTLIVNEGNFGAGNGSISLYDEANKSIDNNILKIANNGAEIDAVVQSVFIHENTGYVVCNSPDKIEIFSTVDGKFLTNPLTDISQPRYMTVVGDKGYITCWGPWGEGYTLPDSYVAVLEINTRTIIDTLECGSGPEGILAIDNKLFIANSFETSITVIEITSGSSQEIGVNASPSQFVYDGGSTVWISMSTGLQSLHVSTLALSELFPATNVSGKMAANQNASTIYLLTAQPWPGTDSEVLAFNTESKKYAATAFITGENFYGIGYNIASNSLYVSDSKGFSGNGVMYVYDSNGDLKDEQVVGIGPNGFAFN